MTKRLALAAFLLLVAAPVWAAPALDVCNAGAGGTGNLSWTHTPSGTPKGVVVIVGQFIGGTDEVTSVTYDGVAMTEVSPSPLCKTSGEPGCAYAYFMGSSVPTGAKTVQVNVSGSSTRRAISCTITAATSTMSVDSVGSLSTDAVVDPSFTISTTAGVETVVIGGGFFGDSVGTNTQPGTGYTTIVDDAPGGGGRIHVERKNTNPTGGSVTVNWTDANSDDAVLIGLAVREPSTNKAGGLVNTTNDKNLVGGGLVP